MYKFTKIVCRSVLSYRSVQSKIASKILQEQFHKYEPRVRLYVTKSLCSKPSLKLIPTNLAIALSILSWLGFTEDDENKESELIMTLKRAVLCTQREQYDKAEQMLHLALRLAQQQQNEQGIIYCYDLMANLAFDRYELDKAEKLFVTVLQMLLSQGMQQENLKVIHISLKLARICQLKANLERAEIGYKWCLEQIDKQKDETVDAQILYGVINDWYAQFLLDKGDLNNSLVHLHEAYKVCTETKSENREKSVLLLNDLGITCFRAEDMDGAEKYLKEAIDAGNSLEDKSHLGVIHANLGLILLHKGILAEAEKCCTEAWHLDQQFFDEITEKYYNLFQRGLIRAYNDDEMDESHEETELTETNTVGKKHENTEAMEQANYCFDQIKLNLGK